LTLAGDGRIDHRPPATGGSTTAWTTPGHIDHRPGPATAGTDQGYNALAIGDSTTGRSSMASQVQMWVRCSGLVRQHMCSPDVVHGISSIQV
jgi:uncharacterized membrane protein YdfJ with MMPL/SSD domain